VEQGLGLILILTALVLWTGELLPILAAAFLWIEELSQPPASAARQESFEALERQSGSTRAQRGMRS